MMKSEQLAAGGWNKISWSTETMSDLIFIEEPQTDSVYSWQRLIGRQVFLVSGLTVGAGHHVSRGVHFLHDGHHPGGLGGGGGGGAAETQDGKEWIN